MSDTRDIIEQVDEPKAEADISPPEESASSESAAAIAAAESPGPRVGNFRWVICSLLFFAATVNYIDRQVIGILKPMLAGNYGWTELDYSWIVFSFQTAYAIGLLFVGKLMDRIGTKLGFALAIIVWSAASIAHAWAIGIGTFSTPIVAPIMGVIVSAFNSISSLFGADPWTFSLSVSVVGFMVVRFVLGLGESGNFPASIKTVAEWFPRKERALATGIFNAGTNIGALATPLVVPLIVLAWGWYEAFIFTGILGFLWLAFWLLIYKRPEEHKRLSKAELAYIQSDPAEPSIKVPWRRLFPHKQTWAFGIGKFLTDPIWWVYLFWLPDFLNK
ncbi:MAG TPA: MFS transporter, partial [Pyrinomonadaceae bacterium]